MGDREELPPGVTPLEHTADVGLQVEAPDLPELFRRALFGMVALLRGSSVAWPPPPRAPRAATGPAEGEGEESTSHAEERAVHVSAGDPAALLRGFLRELLYLHEVEGFVPAGVRFLRLSERELAASVAGAIDDAPPEREIKGVTWHGLEVRPDADGWTARVIFDV